MTTWTAPITFSAGATLTAAQMNAEVRDHLIFLKGVLDHVSDGTTADTGSSTYLSIRRTNAADVAFAAAEAADTAVRWMVHADGKMYWGDGSSAADVSLTRDQALSLNIDGRIGTTRTTGSAGAFQVKTSGDGDETRFVIQADGSVHWGNGSSLDVRLTRSGTKAMQMDDGAGGGIYLNMPGVLAGTTIHSFTEMGDPGAASANQAWLYSRDNGSGKTQLVVVFSSGAVQVLATQP